MASQGVYQLHGGPEGFDKRRWRIVNQNDRQVLFALSSDDGDQGFPGNFGATVRYGLPTIRSLCLIAPQLINLAR
ncbi:hypothetical protein ACNKHT_03660 [Shigella flexneri]